MADMETGETVILNGSTVEARKAELATIFGDKHLLSCMEARLKNTDKPTSMEQAKHRRHEALKAFSENPPEFWDMLDE